MNMEDKRQFSNVIPILSPVIMMHGSNLIRFSSIISQVNCSEVQNEMPILKCAGKLHQEIVQQSNFSAYNSAYASDVQSLIAKSTLQQIFS